MKNKNLPKKKVYIMCGAPGAGKSTYIKNKLPNAFVCSADNFFHNKETGEYKFNVNQLGLAHKHCQQSFIEALDRNESNIVIDNTNTRLKEMEFYVQEALKRNDYRVIVVKVIVPRDNICGRNVHKVPDDKVLEMYDRVLDLQIPNDWNVQLKLVNGYE